MPNNNNQEYFHESRFAQIRNWIMWEMLRGAGYAAAVLLVVLAFILVLVVISWALPDQARSGLDMLGPVAAFAPPMAG